MRRTQAETSEFGRKSETSNRKVVPHFMHQHRAGESDSEPPTEYRPINAHKGKNAEEELAFRQDDAAVFDNCGNRHTHRPETLAPIRARAWIQLRVDGCDFALDCRTFRSGRRKQVQYGDPVFPGSMDLTRRAKLTRRLART